MATTSRHKNANWTLPTSGVSYAGAQLAVLMDIRDELQAINRALGCYRIPRALDAMHDLGVEARRRKRLAAKRRQAKK
ncbi:hypothetical protein [Bradyrhizobium liaoningense]